MRLYVQRRIAASVLMNNLGGLCRLPYDALLRAVGERQSATPTATGSISLYAGLGVNGGYLPSGATTNPLNVGITIQKQSGLVGFTPRSAASAWGQSLGTRNVTGPVTTSIDLSGLMNQVTPNIEADSPTQSLTFGRTTNQSLALPAYTIQGSVQPTKVSGQFSSGNWYLNSYSQWNLEQIPNFPAVQAFDTTFASNRSWGVYNFYGSSLLTTGIPPATYNLWMQAAITDELVIEFPDELVYSETTLLGDNFLVIPIYANAISNIWATGSYYTGSMFVPQVAGTQLGDYNVIVPLYNALGRTGAPATYSQTNTSSKDIVDSTASKAYPYRINSSVTVATSPPPPLSLVNYDTTNFGAVGPI